MVGKEESNWANVDYGSEDKFSFTNVPDTGNKKKRRVPVNWLLLDSQWTVDVICNLRIVKKNLTMPGRR